MDAAKQRVYDGITKSYEMWIRYPGNHHSFCPKIDDTDYEDYNDATAPGDEISIEEKQKRIEDAQERAEISYDLSLMLGIQKEAARGWLEQWVERTNSHLTSCDSCILSWHMGRKRFSKKLREAFDDDVVSIMENHLNDFDKARIDRGLHAAKELLTANPGLSSTKLAKENPAAILALFESLCCLPYLAVPENRDRYFNFVFQQIQAKKPLRLPQVVPTMTIFVFKEDFYKNRYGRVAWESLEPLSLTTKQFDWAVNDYLALAMQSLNKEGVPESQIKLFWEGFLLILNTMSEDLIKHSLRGMDTSPDIYHLAITHLSCKSDEILLVVLRALYALMQKSPRTFWAALSDLQRQMLSQWVFTSSAFPQLLFRSLEYDRLVLDGPYRVPFLATWMKVFINSLEPHELPDVCKSLTEHLFAPRPDIPRESQVTCTVSGLYALNAALEVFIGDKFKIRIHTSIIYISSILNLVVKYTRSVINPAAELRPEDKYNVGLSRTAQAVIHSSLLLDSRTTRAEWAALVYGIKLPGEVNRHSADLWRGFLDLLLPGRLELAKSMLLAMNPLSGIERFRPPKKQVLTHKEKKDFNTEYEKTCEAVGDMIERLGEFSMADLSELCSDKESPTVHTIIASLVHAEDPIKVAGISLIKTMTGEDNRSDAIKAMLNEHLQPVLSSFSDVVKSITYDVESLNPWQPVPNILVCSRDVLDGLCDTDGVLRSTTLTGIEHTAVTAWWTTQWMALNHAFSKLQHWSQECERSQLEDFCRDGMELADRLLAQDGVVASALRMHSPKADSAQSDSNAEALRMVLEQPRANSRGLVAMLKLRDQYLVDVTVAMLKKLLTRLSEFDMELEEQPLKIIRGACVRLPDGRHEVNTNLRDAQKAELLQALGDNREDDDVAEVEIISLKSVDKRKKQSSLDAWSRMGSTATPSGSSSKPAPSRPATDKPSLRQSLKSKPEPKRLLATGANIKEQRQKEKAEKAKRDAAAIAKAKALRGVGPLVQGEGSGLQGISGIQGKDHAPKSDMMVDSSDEDADESSDDDIEMTGMQKPGALDHDARRRALELQGRHAGPVKKVKQVRSAKDMRARLIPPMEVLHQSILEWDIFHEGNDPPNGDTCLSVANTYMSPREYKNTFFPLLRYEAWRSFVTSKNETTSKPFGIKVINRMSVDKFLEVTTSMPVAANKDKDRLGEGDIIIISKSDDPLNQKNVPHCLARIWKTTFKKQNLEVAYRLSSRNNQLLQLLQPGAEFHGIRITNMTTIEREYAALESLQYYDLMDEVLKAKPSPTLNFSDEMVDRVQKNYYLNAGQAKAILNAKDNDGFTLVQGPPGTGKTKTIVAMIGALLTGHVGTASASAVAIKRPPMPGGPQKPAMSKKLLICAPSNAAVDELVLRLKDGVKTITGSHHKIEVLRLGRSEAINAAVRDVTLDNRVKAEMEAEINKNGPGSDRDKLHKEAGEIKVKMSELRPRLDAARAGNEQAMAMNLQREVDGLRRRQAQIGAKIDADKDSGNTFAREADIKRRAIQQRILDNAQVLCATLSGSGHEMFKNLNVEFETVIIDEAAQCVELSALIPLKYGCSKCILVGDPKQLPPTVLSQSAARYGYDQSLFVRMQQNHPEDVHLLDTQYRMHPEISTFPSAEFYERALFDGHDMANLRDQPWHNSQLLGPYRFFDVEGIQERGRKGQSLVNTNELDVAMQLYSRFRTDYPEIDLKGKIGIITPYKAQLFALQQRFSQRYGEAIFEEIEFNTTDAFQGRECEVIIFSCVRASPRGGIGFMTDIRRMNVGLTRAKSSLWILGDSRALIQGEFWAKLIKDAKARDRYTSGNILNLLQRPGQKVNATSSSYQPQNGGWSAQPSRPRVQEDVTMENAPPMQQFASRPSQPQMKTESKPFDLAQRAPSRMPPKSIGGLDEKGEAVGFMPRGMGPPQIQTAPKVEPGSKKRPLDNGDNVYPASKKMVSNQQPQRPIPTGPRAAAVLSRPIPTGPRAAVPMPEPPRAIDPSAMQVLGLTPPSRPPPPPMNNRPPAARPPMNRPPANAPKGPSGAPKKKAAADPFIKKRPNRR